MCCHTLIWIATNVATFAAGVYYGSWYTRRDILRRLGAFWKELDNDKPKS